MIYYKNVVNVSLLLNFRLMESLYFFFTLFLDYLFFLPFYLFISQLL